MELDGDTVISYQGNVDANVANDILRQAKVKLPLLSEKVNIQKKVYSVSVESLENMYKHLNISEEERKKISQYKPLFNIKKDGDNVHVKAGNLIYKKDSSIIKNRLDKINQLNQEEVHKLYYNEIANGKVSEEGNAGLGLLKIAKKSGQKLEYQFQDISDDIMYYTLDTKIRLQ